MCGEKACRLMNTPSVTGSPPRVRGEVRDHLIAVDALRITPACAGRRIGCNHRCLFCSDHPRVCGEKYADWLDCSMTVGSPPRVRGEAVKSWACAEYGRITPACAGRRCIWNRRTPADEDHPRVCGEKPKIREAVIVFNGSPPRVRGED